jgi:hypothetical protein
MPATDRDEMRIQHSEHGPPDGRPALLLSHGFSA